VRSIESERPSIVSSNSALDTGLSAWAEEIFLSINF
jgi:hypothetical protein